MSATRRLVRISTRRTVSRISRRVMQGLRRAGEITRKTTTRVSSPHWPLVRVSRLPLHSLSRHRDGIENLLDDVVSRDGLGFRLVGENNAVTQHVWTDAFDIFGGYVGAPLQQRPGL